MKKPWLLVAVLATLVLSACNSGPAHPEEAEVKQKLVGKYCSEDMRHSLDIGADGRYAGHRRQTSAFGTGMLSEKCEGNYSLRYDDALHSWILSFSPSDKNSNPFIKCKASETTIWTAEKGYLLADTLNAMVDPMDYVSVTNCDL